MALKDEQSPKYAFPGAGTSLLKSPTKSLLYVSRGWLLARCRSRRRSRSRSSRSRSSSSSNSRAVPLLPLRAPPCVGRGRRIMHQTNWLLPSKVKHAFLIVAADRQQKNALAVHNYVLASQSPLTGSCSGVQSKTKRNCRVPNGVFMSRESVLLAARLLLCHPPCGEQLRGCGKDGHIWPGSWSTTHQVRHWVDMNTVPGRKGEQSWHHMQSQ